ncbi:MAG: hypothetical protein Kow0074_12950 [Candidatus Zixiibacteriota bacterium]
MDTLTITEIQELLAAGGTSAKVSIYLPTFRSGKEVEQNAIRFRNLLKEAETRLRESGEPTASIDSLLKPAREMAADSMRWKYQSDGLAVFITRDGMRAFRVPEHFRELVTVSDRFHLKPLLPLVTSDGLFYILALSKNHVRLLQGSRHSISEVPLPNSPGSLAEALKFDDPEKQVQFHTGTAQRGGRRDAVFFGAGDNDPDVKDELRRFCLQIDKGLKAAIHDPNAPLVLAGVEYIHPIFRDAVSHPNILEEGLTGNPDDLSAQDLHSQAWNLVRPHFTRIRERDVERFRELEGTGNGRAGTDLKEIVPAARGGRVEVLFVPLGVQLWGQVNENDGTITLHKDHKPGDFDLLDYAATHTLATRGSVYAVDPQSVPNGKHAAAIYRY